ncbi:vacuolar protein sorting-associated protein 11, partial [Kipferlia bialata]
TSHGLEQQKHTHSVTTPSDTLSVCACGGVVASLRRRGATLGNRRRNRDALLSRGIPQSRLMKRGAVPVCDLIAVAPRQRHTVVVREGLTNVLDIAAWPMSSKRIYILQVSAQESTSDTLFKVTVLVERPLRQKVKQLVQNERYGDALELGADLDRYEIAQIKVSHARRVFDTHPEEALELFLSTVSDGVIEPAEVVKLYLDSGQIPPLVRYLERLQGEKDIGGGPNLTMLLLNSYVRSEPQKLVHFIESAQDKYIKDAVRNRSSAQGQGQAVAKPVLDIDVAVEVCARSGKTGLACDLAAFFDRHTQVMDILTRTPDLVPQAVMYLGTLSLKDCHEQLTPRLSTLLTHTPDQVTSLLKRLCTSYTPDSVGVLSGLEVDDRLWGRALVRRHRAKVQCPVDEFEIDLSGLAQAGPQESVFKGDHLDASFCVHEYLRVRASRRERVRRQAQEALEAATQASEGKGLTPAEVASVTPSALEEICSDTTLLEFLVHVMCYFSMSMSNDDDTRPLDSVTDMDATQTEGGANTNNEESEDWGLSVLLWHYILEELLHLWSGLGMSEGMSEGAQETEEDSECAPLDTGDGEWKLEEEADPSTHVSALSTLSASEGVTTHAVLDTPLPSVSIDLNNPHSARDSCRDLIMAIFKGVIPASFDKDHACILCKRYDFADGLVFLLGALGQHNEVIRHHLRTGNHAMVSRMVVEHPRLVQEVWPGVLRDMVKADLGPLLCESERDREKGGEAGREREREKQQAAARLGTTLQALTGAGIATAVSGIDLVISACNEVQAASAPPSSDRSGDFPVSMVADLMTSELRILDDAIDQARRDLADSTDLVEKDMATLRTLTTSGVSYDGTICQQCNRVLSTPAVHCRCGHSYHFGCFISEGGECRTCVKRLDQEPQRPGLEPNPRFPHTILIDRLRRAPLAQAKVQRYSTEDSDSDSDE